MTDKRDRYRTAIETGDFEVLRSSLSRRVRLYTPVRPEPLEGRDSVLGFLGQLVQILQEFSFIGELDSADPDAKALVFRATVPAVGDIGPVEIQATDLLRFRRNGRIKSITAMARPIQALQALAGHGVSIPDEPSSD